MDHRKNWTQQQDELRKLVGAKAHFAAAMALFAKQHSAVHTASVYGTGDWSLEDEALTGLTDDQIRFCPPREINSIAWLVWHAARIEDMTMNTLVFEQTQELAAGGWSEHLGLALSDCGAGMDESDVRQFSERVNVPALKDYHAAVGRRVRAGVVTLTADLVKEKISPAALAALSREGSISAKAPWLAEFYANRPKGFFLIRTATSHNFLHISQAARLGASLRKSPN